MQSLLEAGYTTVLSGGGPGDGNLTLRDHIESGMINGPRVIPSERINLKGTPEEARAAIRAMAAKGIKQLARSPSRRNRGRLRRKSKFSRPSSMKRPRLACR